MREVTVPRCELEANINAFRDIAGENAESASRYPEQSHMRGWYEGRAGVYTLMADLLERLMAEADLAGVA